MNIMEKISQHHIELPDVPVQSGHYLLAQTIGNLVYISGMTCKWNGQMQYKGKVGETVSAEEGYEAAKICALNLLSVLQSKVGDLNKVKQIVKVVGYVNCHPEFADIPKVINGASDLLIDLYGQRGEHARCAVGVASLPGKASVEVDMVVELSHS